MVTERSTVPGCTVAAGVSPQVLPDAGVELSGTALRGRREALGLTQAALAACLGVTSTTVARWERGEKRIGNPERVSAALARLANAANSQFAARHNLPAHVSSFVGRDADLLNT